MLSNIEKETFNNGGEFIIFQYCLLLKENDIIGKGGCACVYKKAVLGKEYALKLFEINLKYMQ